MFECSCSLGRCVVISTDISIKYQYVRSISGLVVEYIVAIDVTRVRFPADALLFVLICMYFQ